MTGREQAQCTGYGRYAVRCRRIVVTADVRPLCHQHEHQRAYLEPVDPLAARGEA